MRRVRHDSGSGEDSEVDKPFTKGPWTSAEDDLLIAYVDKHGDGNWNSVQNNSGLSRCGKSCRLRWVNHLRPDLKKGSFTKKEEQRVIELHAAFGNKWARMASELPGRTDNEIKNFWNTRLKRLQRLGLPIYPDDVREQAMNSAAQTGQNTQSLDAHAHHSQQSLEPHCFDIPEVGFKFLEVDQCSSYLQSMLSNVPPGGMMKNVPYFFQPNTYSNLIASPSRKRAREPETVFPYTDGYAMNEQSAQLWNYPFVDSTSEQLNVLPDSHLFGNATYSSASEPLIHDAEKLELPSFQCFDLQDEPGVWGTQQANLMPPLESDNTFVQSPLRDRTLSPSTLYDGLLESIVYGSSWKRRATDTASESSLLNSSLLGNIELAPASANTTGHNSNFETDLGHVGPSSSNETRAPFDGDWIKYLLGEDRNDTK